MHFLVGWPAAIQLPPLTPLATVQQQQQQQQQHGLDPSLPLSLAAITDPIRSVAHTRDRTHMALVTDTALYLFHFQQVSGSNLSDDDHSDEIGQSGRPLTSDSR